MNSDELTIHDGSDFVTAQDVPLNSDHPGPAYVVTCPSGVALGIPAGSPVVPEFRDASGAKLDERTEVRIQKCDPQGRPVATVFREQLARFRYDRMRTDPDYFRKTRRDVLLKEDERLTVYVDLPDGAPGFCADQSRFALGDTTSSFGEAVEWVALDSLNGDQAEAIEAASGGVGSVQPAPGHRTPGRPTTPATRQQRDETDSEGRPDARVAYQDFMDDDEERLLEEETSGLPADELARWWREVSDEEVPDEDDVDDQLDELEREVVA